MATAQICFASETCHINLAGGGFERTSVLISITFGCLSGRLQFCAINHMLLEKMNVELSCSRVSGRWTN